MIIQAEAINTYYNDSFNDERINSTQTLKVVHRTFSRAPESFEVEQTPECCDIDNSLFSNEVGVNYEFVTKYFVIDFKETLDRKLKENNIPKSPAFEIYLEELEDSNNNILRILNQHPCKDELENILNLTPELINAFHDISISVEAYKSAIEMDQNLYHTNSKVIKRFTDESEPCDFSILVSQNSYFINIKDYSISFPNCLLD